MKLSDAEIISLLFDEQASDPATPAAGFWRIYTKSTGLFLIDDAGVVSGPFGSAADLTAHLADTTDAHDASAISADSTTLVGTGTDVQAVLEELDNGIADHLADTTAAHAATAIAFTPAGTIAATTVQAAIEEVATEAGAGGAIRVEDEGSTIVAAATGMNFAGAGVVVTDAGSNEALVTIAGGGTTYAGQIQFSQPTHATTRASSTLGALATPWTDTITTTAGLPKVKYDVQISMQCSSDETLYAAITCDGTIIDRVKWYMQSATTEQRITLNGIHTPSEGAHTYEIFVASNSGSTITVNTTVNTSTTVSTTADGVSSMQLQAVATA